MISPANPMSIPQRWGSPSDPFLPPHTDCRFQLADRDVARAVGLHVCPQSPHGYTSLIQDSEKLWMQILLKTLF